VVLVKAVAVRLTAEGERDAELKIGRVAAAADDLGAMHPTIVPQIEARKALMQARLLRLGIDAELRGAAMSPGLGGGGIGGIAGGAGAGVVQGAAPAGGLLAAAGGAPLLTAGIVATVAGLVAGLGGIIPALAAAGMGVTAFGALAFPTFSKVGAAVTKLDAATTQAARNKAWAAIPEQIRPLVRGWQDLTGLWGKMSGKLAPDVMKIMNEGLKIAGKLLPDMLPFAKTAATAIDGLLKQFDKFSSSPGFKAFLANMVKLEGPAITAIGEGIGKVAVGLGRLLTGLETPAGLRLMGDLFTALGNTLSWLGNAAHYMAVHNRWNEIIRWAVDTWHGVNKAWQALSHAWDNVVHAYDNFSHASSATWAAIVHGWNNTTNAVNDAVAAIEHAFGNVIHAGGVVIHWFALLPGRIGGFFAKAGSWLWNAGAAIIQGLWDGAKSVAGGLLRWLNGIGSSIAGAISGALGIHSPSRVMHRVGVHAMDGLITGMASRMPALGAVTGSAAAAMIPGPGYGQGYGGGLVRVQLEWVGGSPGDDFLAWLRGKIRVKGGTGPGSVQAALS
jgi:hypothetical protein